MTYVYRCYSDDGRLLYVGAAEDIERRLREHCRSLWSPWVGQLADIAVEWHPDRGTAEDIERQAIASESPLYNITHSADRRKARAMVRQYERDGLAWDRAERKRRTLELYQRVAQMLLRRML
jgi:predicted GIY-YIG superfamily endonuclease